MESTEKQKVACRQNGTLGGVKTLEGKQISRMNALKHGIMAKLKTKFDDIEYLEIFEMFSDEFGADSPSRAILIEQLSWTYLRLRRCIRFDSEAIREALNPPRYETVIIEKAFDLGLLNEDKTETRLVDLGEPATLNVSTLDRLDGLYSRYEPVLTSKLIKLIEILSQRTF